MLTHGVHGPQLCSTFLVNVLLPNGVQIANLVVTEGKLTQGTDVLIGMDIISMGDFTLTQRGGTTWMSFRMPSQARVDYVVDIDPHRRGGQAPQKRPGKQFGKSKRR